YPNEEYGITREDIEDMFSKNDNPETLERVKERIKNLGEHTRILVVEIDRKIVGTSRILREESRGKFQTCYVLPEYQGKGIGSMFWNNALKWFDVEKDIFLEVAVYNKNAIYFYEKLGFVDTGKRISDERFKLKSGVVIPEIEMVFKR
ncbi:MAG: GNAT family N-acetyltransferase, partial [bacterium]